MVFRNKRDKTRVVGSHIVHEAVQVEKEREEALNVAWRRDYDRHRAQALAEGRGCGKCIEGLVWFGRHIDDFTPCRLNGVDCKFAKQPDSEAKAE